jgi:hypothetical protein
MSRTLNPDFCAGCRCYFAQGDTTAESGLYDHGEDVNILLCEPCFFDEEALDENAGTNDLPHIRETYKANIKLGAAR